MSEHDPNGINKARGMPGVEAVAIQTLCSMRGMLGEGVIEHGVE